MTTTDQPKSSITLALEELRSAQAENSEALQQQARVSQRVSDSEHRLAKAQRRYNAEIGGHRVAEARAAIGA